MTKDIQKYMKAIQKRMACFRVRKKQFLRDFELEVCQFQTNTGANYEEIISHFGKPEQVAKSFMDALDQEEVNRYQLFRRNIFVLIIIVLLLVLSGVLYSFYYYYQHAISESETEIETIIYLDEAPPEGFTE